MSFVRAWAVLTAAAVLLPGQSTAEETALERAGFTAQDWPWWRGPGRGGIAPAEQSPPRSWSEGENILWKSPVPGRGHGSPTVVGERVFLAGAEEEEQTQFVLCFDRQSGKRLWKTDVHRGGFPEKMNKKASNASSTPACDGERLFINFLSGGAVYTTALSLSGELLWQTKISDYVLHQGYGSSPAVYGDLVLVTADNKGGGAVAGLKRDDGQVVWRHERPETPNYASPIIVQAAGRDQLVLTGCDRVAAFDPVSGERLWETEGATTECVTSTVTDGTRVFTSGGYPKNHMSAVMADGSGEIVWENKTRVYVPSMLVKDGCLYAVTDAGVAACYRCDSGEELWQGRLGGNFTSSPVLVGEVIYATNEEGRTYLFRADPGEFTLLGENQLGDEVYATPVICGGCIFQRVAETKDGRRSESLYCIGTR